jgi:hypothetical protein
MCCWAKPGPLNSLNVKLTLTVNCVKYIASFFKVEDLARNSSLVHGEVPLLQFFHVHGLLLTKSPLADCIHIYI